MLSNDQHKFEPEGNSHRRGGKKGGKTRKLAGVGSWKRRWPKPLGMTAFMGGRKKDRCKSGAAKAPCGFIDESRCKARVPGAKIVSSDSEWRGSGGRKQLDREMILDRTGIIGQVEI